MQIRKTLKALSMARFSWHLAFSPPNSASICLYPARPEACRGMQRVITFGLAITPDYTTFASAFQTRSFAVLFAGLLNADTLLAAASSPDGIVTPVATALLTPATAAVLAAPITSP